VTDSSGSGIAMAVVIAVNSVIALFYYASIGRRMWADDVPDGDKTPIRVPPSLFAALGITVVVTLLFGIFPQALGHFTEVSLAAVGG
jgi:NADH-quinone oxidoreductase subunit N